jgi:myosin heavy subunit
MNTGNSNTSTKLQELKQGLEQIKALENRLKDSEWRQSPSPRSVADFQSSLLERYEQAKALYIRRRLEIIACEKVATYDPNTNEFELPETDDDGEEQSNTNIDQAHAQALAALETTVQSVHAKLSQLRNTYEAVCTRRQELEQMIQDLEQEDYDDSNILDDGGDNVVHPKEQDIESEQKKIEDLQQRKQQLQYELDVLKREREEKIKRVLQHRREFALLEEEENRMNREGKDPEEFRAKIQELKQMQEFYDNLREILEELGGVKILGVKEDRENQHLHLTILIFQKHKVEIEMEVYRKNSLKLVGAKMIGNSVVLSTVACEELFSLAINPLDDLVQFAKTSMGPPHDVRFLIRETCARIRILQDRVNDLAILRQHVLTRVVGNNQIVCSLNEGLVIVMRLYDQWVRVEQIVGVNGWTKDTTDKIHAAVPDKDESLKPTMVVEIVQKEISRLQHEDGLVLPKTPVLPKRKEANLGD